MRDVRVCVFGDSFVAGVGDPKALGWVGRVVARTPSSTGVDLTVYQLGVRGESVEDVVVRMPTESAPRFARGDEHGVVVSVGVADAQARIPAERSAATLEFGLGSTNVRRLVIGPPPVGSPDVRARIADLDVAFDEVCARLTVPYVSTHRPLADHRPWLEQAFTDGLHPGQAGYGMLAYVVLHGGWYDWLGVEAPVIRDRTRRGDRGSGRL